MKATIHRRVERLEFLIKQKRLEEEKRPQLVLLTPEFERAVQKVREKEALEAAQKEAQRLAKLTPEEAAAEEEAKRVEAKARLERIKEFRKEERAERKFEKYLDRILVKPWRDEKGEDESNYVYPLYWAKPYSFAFYAAAREEIVEYAKLEQIHDAAQIEFLFGACKMAAARRICREVVEARVPPSERRYFFDPRSYMRVDWKHGRKRRVVMLRILVNPRGGLRKECIALARKLDARGDQNHNGMVFELTTGRVNGFEEIHCAQAGGVEMVAYHGPRSEEEWWAAVHATSDRPISGQDPTRPYPPFTEETKRLIAKKQKHPRLKQRS
jgi:hypothetical protein